MLSKVSLGTKCLNLEIMQRDQLIFEEINDVCCRQMRVESMRTPRYLNIVLPLQKNQRIFIIKELYGFVEVHTFLIRPKNYKWDFFVLRDNLFAISQLHTLVSSLLLQANGDSYQHREGLYHQQPGKNSIDQTDRKYH